MYSNLPQKIDRDIAAQLKSLGIGERRTQKHQFPCITISREFGCEGVPVAQGLVEKLSTEDYPWILFHRKLIKEISQKDALQSDLADIISDEKRNKLHQYIEQMLSHKPINVQQYKKLGQTIRVLSTRGRSVILGAGAAILASEIPHALHIRLRAPMDFRVKRVSELLDITDSEAREKIRENDTERQEFIYEFTRKDLRDPHHYHLIIDNSNFDASMITELIYHALVLRNMLPEVK